MACSSTGVSGRCPVQVRFHLSWSLALTVVFVAAHIVVLAMQVSKLDVLLFCQVQQPRIGHRQRAASNDEFCAGQL